MPMFRVFRLFPQKTEPYTREEKMEAVRVFTFHFFFRGGHTRHIFREHEEHWNK